jgi:prolyl-tRNA synthetase, family II
MLLSKLVGSRLKDDPADAVIKSHALMLRAGFIKGVGSGIWTLAMPAKRIARKIENIIREEMDAIDGQEVTFPVVMPRELWEESGRYYSIGEEMARFKDRNGRDLVLGMTHEEAAVHFARDFVTSYQQLPFMIYQIQTKFRDEARPRGGLIRVREFTMKDAYSFHISDEDLKEYYARAFKAYENIFRRVGMKKVVAVQSDSGMMGGNISHEFMSLADVGEDTLVLCDNCGYKANMEVAECKRDAVRDEESSRVAEVFTGEAKEIAEVSNFLHVAPEKTIKAVCYNIKGESGIVLAFIRGDLEINEAKLRKVVKKEIAPASLADSRELVAGNIGPLGLKSTNATIVFDKSLENAGNMVVGANKPLYHLTGVDVGRDLKIEKFYDIAKVKEGERCPVCGGPLKLNNGIEVGNIFQLGIKYTKAMGMTVLNKEGAAVYPIMGCYGIGVGRAMASVAEESSDEKGLVWPMSIAPWQVYLCPLRLDDKAVKERADALYKELEAAGIETLYDDREVSPGYKFADCDLMGIPIRLVVSPRTLKAGEYEIKLRDGSLAENISAGGAVQRLKEIIALKGG